MKVPPYAYLVLGFAWLALAIDRLFLHTGDAWLGYLTLILGLGFLAQFLWVKRRA